MNKNAHHCQNCDLSERCNNSRSDCISGLCFSDRQSAFISFELQIRWDRHRRSGHVSLWDRSDRRSGSINFLLIYSQIAELTVSPSNFYSHK